MPEKQIFTVPYSLEEIKENINLSTYNYSNLSQEEIIDKACKYHLEGNIYNAAK